MTWTLKVDSPYSGEVVFEIPLLHGGAVDGIVDRARKAQRACASLSLSQRLDLCKKWLELIESRAEELARELTWQMGKPLAEARGEIRTMADRARQLMALAPDALASEVLPEKEGFFRKIVREPVGVVMAIAAWNYPYLIAVNSVLPAVLAGDAVILKHSERSPRVGDAFAAAFDDVGAPTDLVQAVHCTHDVAAAFVRHPGVDYVAFTGSVGGGRSVHAAAAGTLKPVATELGGKDAAYVRADADLDFTIGNLVEGGCYNAGQSCCAIERVYVHQSVYDQVVEGMVAEARKLVIGDPAEPGTTLGPMAQAHHPAFVERQVEDARQKGARVLTGGGRTTHQGRGRFFEPTIIADCDHTMSVMTEETFGPVLALAKVSSDDEAVSAINDSRYGLTCSIWTRDQDAALALAPRLQVGTVFTNRADFLDPMLPWTGVKDTGSGVSLSRHGFGPMTRLKGYHFRLR